MGGRVSDKITRRLFVSSMGVASIAPTSALLAAPRAAAGERAGGVEPVDLKPTYTFFNSAEAQFIEAACERLIPADELGPGALGAWVPNYLDKQLGGAWGNGERLYRSGPWIAGSPSQGYQLPFTPAEPFHAALSAINRSLQARGSKVSDLNPDSQDEYLRELSNGGPDLDFI